MWAGFTKVLKTLRAKKIEFEKKQNERTVAEEADLAGHKQSKTYYSTGAAYQKWPRPGVSKLFVAQR